MLRKILATTSLVALIGAPALADNHQADIVDTAIAAGEFNTLVAAVQAAGLEETLRGEGPFTVFAPTDDAFAALPEGTVEALLADIPALTSILTYHVVPGAVMSGALTDGMVAETVNGQIRDLHRARHRAGRQRHRDHARHRGVERRDPRHRRGDPARVTGDRCPADAGQTGQWAPPTPVGRGLFVSAASSPLRACAHSGKILKRRHQFRN
jgi:hypothetical protein